MTRPLQVRPAVISIDGKSLTLAQFRAVVHEGAACSLADAARRRVDAGRRTVEETVRRGDATYGVNTGFGNLATVRIEEKNLALLQERLILSHCAGVGEPLPDAGVRGMLVGRPVRIRARRGRPSLSYEEVIRDHAGDLGIPVVTGFPAGHGAHKVTLPLGVPARLDTSAERLEILL